MVYKFFDEKSTSLADKSAKGGGATILANKSVIKNQITQNQQLAEELHKPIIRKLKKEQLIPHLMTITGVLI